MIKSQNEEIFFCFTVDIDSDCFFGNKFSKTGFVDKTILGWKGFDKGKNILAEMATQFSDSFNNSLPITWFVRCDGQLKSQYKDSAYLLNHYSYWWEERIKVGDDIQWHAHLYSYKKGIWSQEVNIISQRYDILEGKKVFEKFGIFPSAIRIGESYHSNELMNFLDDLGLRADCTSIPGRKRLDNEKLLNWELTPNLPYHPSRLDYRISGNEHLKIWEIPMNTVLTQVSYDKNPLLRYVNLAFHPGILNDGLRTFICNHNILVSITHPYELLTEFFSDSKMDSHPLLAFNPEAIVNNIKTIFKIAFEVGKKIRFVTIKELLSRLDNYCV